MGPHIVEQLAAATRPENGLEGLTRSLLELVGEITGLESTYLTLIDWGADEQEILYSRNTGALTIPEGARFGWSDTLCRRALEDGIACTTEVPTLWGDSEAAAALNLQTYVSFPVIAPGGEIFGTLCGASGERHDVEGASLDLLRLCAHLVAAQLAREERLKEQTERADSAETRLLSRAEFLAIAEHQLKTPLTVVLGLSTMLDESWDSFDDAVRHTYAGTVRRQSEVLRDHVDRMLESARTEVLLAELAIADLDARAEVTSVVEAFAKVSPDHAIEFEWHAQETTVKADSLALYQVLGHLIENAIKHSDSGPIVVGGTTEQGRLVLTVRDDGPGLPPDVDVFAPFARGQTPTRGVGLGLHIVRSLTEAMGGTVLGETRNEGGAIFTLSLPLA